MNKRENYVNLWKDTNKFNIQTVPTNLPGRENEENYWAVSEPSKINATTKSLLFLHGMGEYEVESWYDDSEAFRKFISEKGEEYNICALVPSHRVLDEEQIDYVVNYLNENNIKNMTVVAFSAGAREGNLQGYFDLLRKTDDVQFNLMFIDGGFKNFEDALDGNYDLVKDQNFFFFEGHDVYNFEKNTVAQNMAKAGGNVYFFRNNMLRGDFHTATDVFATESLDFFLNPNSEYNIFEHFYVSTIDENGNQVQLTTSEEIRVLSGIFDVKMTDDKIYQIELEASYNFANYEILCKDEIIREELSKLKNLYVGTKANSQFTSYGSTTRMPNIIGQCVNEINKSLAGMLVDIETHYKNMDAALESWQALDEAGSKEVEAIKDIPTTQSTSVTNSNSSSSTGVVSDSIPGESQSSSSSTPSSKSSTGEDFQSEQSQEVIEELL